MTDNIVGTRHIFIPGIAQAQRGNTGTRSNIPTGDAVIADWLCIEVPWTWGQVQPVCCVPVEGYQYARHQVTLSG